MITDLAVTITYLRKTPH